jgi:hypothetical protein
MQRLTSDRHEAPPVAAITTGSAHTENPNGVPAGRPRHADSTPQASDREARNTRMHSTRPRQTVSPRCSTSRHRATNSSRDTWRFPRGMASTARAVTSMHLIVTQHTDRLLPFDAALNGVAAADHCPVPVTTWSCSTLEPNWLPFSKLARRALPNPVPGTTDRCRQDAILGRPRPRSARGLSRAAGVASRRTDRSAW